MCILHSVFHVLCSLCSDTAVTLWLQQKASSSGDVDAHCGGPYIDISITNNAAVRASDFRESLCRNRIFEISLPHSSVDPPDQNKENEVAASQLLQPALPAKARGSVDHGGTTAMECVAEEECRHAGLSGINLFESVENVKTFRIACCILWAPQLAHDVLLEFLSAALFEVDGMHKRIPSLQIDDSLLCDPSGTAHALGTSSPSGGLTPLGFHGRSTSAEHDSDGL